MSSLHIVGSGPAGLSAAHTAVNAGAKVCLIDDNPAPGGQIWRGGPGKWIDRRAAAMWHSLDAHPDFTQLKRASVIGAVAPDTLLLEIEGEGLRLPFERLLLCSGARELLLPFAGWTLPGVVGAGGLQALIKGGMPVRQRKVVIAGSGPLLLATALSALQAGAQVEAIIEHQPSARLATFGLGLLLRHREKFLQAVSLFARLWRIPYLTGAQIVEARGDGVLQGVVIEKNGAKQEYACDFLAAGFGLVPNVDLARALGCDIADDAIAVDRLQRTSRTNIWAAGECTGVGGVDKAIVEGRIAALGALGLPPSPRDLSLHRQCHDFAALLAHNFAPDASLREMCRPGIIVCRCEDVRASSLAGQHDWRQAKLNTRIGMGPCQGKTCGPACQFLYGWSLPASRLPIMPASARVLSQID
ncbi:FAD/NAD(P)-binding oxidoreductase [Massilia terrae]|uniref:FAD-dependent oxidoreductase n=1 Tax=Massilia terrae TaxID=1811224 RepID=A0ABT2CT19_9BURK|nr:FAD-dependent oxidoreductase [Massilia terrae]MCS0657112.1 FAD-dependent oxidoreductase [Massilia terrae]